MKATGACPECGRDGLVLRQPNRLIPRHKPADDAHATRNGYCRGSGAWVDERAPTHAYSGWNGGSV